MIDHRLDISIITVCFNEPADKIRRTFASIASQTYSDIEWIVIDGGSGEETLTAINEFSENINILVSEPDNGIYDAMNKGISRASGNMICFMNVGDVFVGDDTVSRAAERIVSQADYDCYYGDVICVDSELAVTWLEPQIRSVDRFHLYSRNVCHQAIFARRELFDRIGEFNLDYSLLGDRDWIIRSVTSKARWLHLGFPVCEYDRGGLSSDLVKKRAEEDRLLRASYAWWERAAFYLGWKVLGAARRIRCCLGRESMEC